MAKKKINLGVIGVGAMGVNHVRILSQLENVHLAAIADNNRQRVNYAANLYRVRPYKDYKAMLAQESLDAVILAVPTSLHYDLAKYIIENGAHLLVEKPLAATTADCRQIIKLAKAKKVILGVGHVERFNPVVSELKRHLLNGKLGRIFQIVIRRIGPFPQRIKDIGVFLDLATHDIDVMCYLAESKILRISAESNRLIHSQHEDLAVATLRFTNGIIGVLVENWLSPTKLRDIYINTEKGMLVADFISQDFYFYENNYTPSAWDSLAVFRGMTEGNMTRYYIRREEPLKLELLAFVESVITKKPFLVTSEDGLKAVEVAQKLLKSANK